MHGIFICYRRNDSSGFAGRVYDHLKKAFGKNGIFFDVEKNEMGMDFMNNVHKALNSSKVMLVFIGKQWLVRSKGKRRIDDPRDLVRQEIKTALDKKILIIPVLVGGARLPSRSNLPEELNQLLRYQAHEIRNDHFNQDTPILIKRLKKELGFGDQRSNRESRNITNERKAKVEGVAKLINALASEMTEPLVEIIRLVEEIKHEKETTKIQNYASNIDLHARRSLQTLQEAQGFFDYSKMKESYEALNVNDLLTETLKLLRLSFEDSSIQIQTDFQNVPQVWANAIKLRQLFINILINGLEAMEGEGILSVSTGSVGGDVIITISDSGRGIPPKLLKKIFNPFFTTKAGEAGSGLGLSVSKSIAEEHGGGIFIESGVGEGTTCNIKIPVK